MPLVAPATLLLIIQGIQAAVAAAPQIAEVIKAAKDMIDALFTAKLIDSAQQGALHQFVAAAQAMALAGINPWPVEPDPA